MGKKKKQKTDFTPYEDRAALCPYFGLCGGCACQKISYGKQLALKSAEVERLLCGVYEDFLFEGIIASPAETGYRNKMEFTFGDTCKDGPFALGLHQQGSWMNIVDIRECILVHPDMNLIRNAVRDYFSELYAEKRIDFKNNRTQRGYLRHLLLRRAEKTGEILAALVTASPEKSDVPGFDENKETEAISGFLRVLQELEESGQTEGRLQGALHITNNAVSDIVRSDHMEVLYGSAVINEEVLGLKFRISPFSFFQTNTKGAELLYEKAREYAKDICAPAAEPFSDEKLRHAKAREYQKGARVSFAEPSSGAAADSAGGGVLFDLYSGTGTIAQLMAPAADRVIGVELAAEAVETARENARLNHIENVSFIAGDVLKVLDELPVPDSIILDPPREGIHPKALGKILSYGADHILYISCKPTSLARDLASFQLAGYQLVKACCVDMFPQTWHVETVVLMSKVQN